MPSSASLPIGPPVPDWRPRALPPREPMVGRYCTLEPLDPESHAQALFEAYREDENGRGWTYLAYGPFEAAGEWHAWLRANATGNDPQFFAVVDADRGPLGVTSYLRIEPQVGSIEVGHIHYAPALRKTRAATEAMYLMMRRAFDELGYRRYEWKCDALNAASCAAAERLGFTYEGTFRQATIYKGRNRDTAWYSIIDTEWPQVRAAMERWLDPSNFDEEGRQREALAIVRSA